MRLLELRRNAKHTGEKEHAYLRHTARQRRARGPDVRRSQTRVAKTLRMNKGRNEIKCACQMPLSC